MKRFLGILMAIFLIFGTTGSAMAFVLDFENGTDGAEVIDIVGVDFQSFNGYAPLYADSSTGSYNTTSDDLGQSWGTGNYHHNGYFCVWAGPNADAQGIKIDFTNNDGTWFTTGYSAYSAFYVEAWLTDGSMVSILGAANTGSPMGYLTINATAGEFIDYIVLHDTGNYWCVDDMSGNTTGIPNGVPEPATMVLLGTGLFGLAIFRRKKNQR